MVILLRWTFSEISVLTVLGHGFYGSISSYEDHKLLASIQPLASLARVVIGKPVHREGREERCERPRLFGASDVSPPSFEGQVRVSLSLEVCLQRSAASAIGYYPFSDGECKKKTLRKRA
jgi:hypothetical protein